MKKFIAFFIMLFAFFIFDNHEIKGQGGLCILKQQNSTYEIETPFYWYTVIQESISDGLLNETINYRHTSTIIENNEQCNSLNNISPTYEYGFGNNILNNRITNFYYNDTLLSNSESIYKNSLQIFKIPSRINTIGFNITSHYISLDNMPPIISNDETTSTIIVNVSSKISIDEIKSKIYAYDENDGPIEVKIHEDNYTSNYKKLGTYSIIFSATDKSGNIAYLTINIKIIDTIKPQINGQTKINSYMSSPLTIEQIKAPLTISDNYDTNLTNLVISNDTYTNNIENEGTFEITFLAYDNSNNESNPFIVQISMIDDIAPTIEGSNSYNVNVKSFLNIETILKQLIATDNIDKNPLLKINDDNYSNNYYITGIYQISFVAVDKNDNISSPFIINIIVEDIDKPIFYISKKFIGANCSFEIKIEDLIETINEINNIDPNNIANIKILENTYTQNYDVVGTYILKVEYQQKDNTQMIIQSNIIVEDYNKSTPKKSFWSAIKSYFLKILKIIVNWLKKLI